MALSFLLFQRSMTGSEIIQQISAKHTDLSVRDIDRDRSSHPSSIG
jgi:hypothetical protein